MSGIAGIYFLDGRQVERNLLDQMQKSIEHRGHDSSGIWFNESVGLGQRMLFTTEESLHEKLPLEEKDVVLVADARIDNRKELINALDLSKARIITDSEIILNAYIKWGESCA